MITKLPFLLLLVIPSVLAGADNVTIEPDLKPAEENSLWTGLVQECHRDPSMACVQNHVVNYLKETFDDPRDIELTDLVTLVKNSVDYDKFPNFTNSNSSTGENVDFGETRGLERVSRSLHDKAVKFLMTHDVEVRLPEMISNGTTLRVSPRSFEGDNGALVKLELSPKAQSEGRLFKKLKKFISGNLMWAFMAILLVIKMLAAKFLFILPSIVGAVAAKKLLMKLLLFIFPFLSHLFKMCPYLPHATKFHHHKHKIAHIHLLGGHGHGPPGHLHHGHGPHHKHHGSVEVIAPHADGPPSLHHSLDLDPPHENLYDPYEQDIDFYPGSPSTYHFVGNDRQDEAGDENEVQPHGQGQSVKKKVSFGKPLAPSEIEMMLLKAEKEAKIKSRLQQERLKIQEENSRLQDQLKQALRLQEKLMQQATLVKNRVNQYVPSLVQHQQQYLSPPPAPQHSKPVTPTQIQPIQPIYAKPNNQTRYSSAQSPYGTSSYLPQPQSQAQRQPQQIGTSHEEIVQKVVKKNQLQPEQVHQRNPPIPSKRDEGQKTKQGNSLVQALHEAASITYDPFYSPILGKIDKILIGLGFNDEGCRERLICSMYSSPVKFSPHSNLLSAELSRDSKELQKPTSTNAAVVRFYRYVQAARDGQDKRDCLRLYANCSINTEQ